MKRTTRAAVMSNFQRHVRARVRSYVLAMDGAREAMDAARGDVTFAHDTYLALVEAEAARQICQRIGRTARRRLVEEFKR